MHYYFFFCKKIIGKLSFNSNSWLKDHCKYIVINDYSRTGILLPESGLEVVCVALILEPTDDILKCDNQAILSIIVHTKLSPFLIHGLN